MYIRIYTRDEHGQYVAWHNVIPAILREEWVRVFQKVEVNKDGDSELSHPVLLRSDIVYAIEP